MAKRGKQRVRGFNRFTRSLGLWCAFLIIVSCLALTTTLVMDIIGLNPYELESPRTYTVQFQNEDDVIFTWDYKRGDLIDRPADPKHSESEEYKYTFRGWDLSGDNSPDIIPKYAYFDFRAVAVYQRIPIKSSSKKDSSEEQYNSSYEGSFLGV